MRVCPQQVRAVVEGAKGRRDPQPARQLRHVGVVQDEVVAAQLPPVSSGAAAQGPPVMIDSDVVDQMLTAAGRGVVIVDERKLPDPGGRPARGHRRGTVVVGVSLDGVVGRRPARQRGGDGALSGVEVDPAIGVDPTPHDLPGAAAQQAPDLSRCQQGARLGPSPDAAGVGSEVAEVSHAPRVAEQPPRQRASRHPVDRQPSVDRQPLWRFLRKAPGVHREHPPRRVVRAEH